MPKRTPGAFGFLARKSRMRFAAAEVSSIAMSAMVLVSNEALQERARSRFRRLRDRADERSYQTKASAIIAGSLTCGAPDGNSSDDGSDGHGETGTCRRRAQR